MLIEESKLPPQFQENLCKYRTIVYYYDGINVSHISKTCGKEKTTIKRWIEKTGDVLT